MLIIVTLIITINRFGFDNLTGYYANHFQTDIFARERITTGTNTVAITHSAIGTVTVAVAVT